MLGKADIIIGDYGSRIVFSILCINKVYLRSVASGQAWAGQDLGSDKYPL